MNHEVNIDDIILLKRNISNLKPCFLSRESFPVKGIENKLYIDTNTGTVYIWKDNSYITANTDIAASLKTVNGISLDGPGDISFSGVNIEIVDNFSNLPDPSSALNLFYFCSNSQGTQWLPGSVGK
jgi:hypothetical protein